MFKNIHYGHRANWIKWIFFIFFILPGLDSGAQVISTFAGTGTVGSSGNGGPATSAELFDPQGVCTDNEGNVYIADHGNGVVRKVDTAGIITIFAGTGVNGYSGDGGPATSAQLNYPYGVCADNSGNIYITGSNMIRKVDATGIISTIAGNLNFGFSGDGGPATAATLFGPSGICIDNVGNIYFAEFSNSVIRKIDTAGIITTVAGSQQAQPGTNGDGGLATSATLSSPTDVAVDSAGNIYIADMSSSSIRKVNASSGIITTFAGGKFGAGYSGDGGLATQCKMKFPYGVYVDKKGNVYIGDTGNGVVREVNDSGIITTIAGNGTIGYSGDGGLATRAELTTPGSVYMDNAGNVYVADAGAHVIRKIGNCPLAYFSSQPRDTVFCNTGTDVITVSANNASQYQWQENTGSGWNDLVDNATYSGSLTNKLTVSNAGTSFNGYQYRCMISNNCGSLFSNKATLNVLTPATPYITISTSTDTICKGSSSTFIASIMNSGSSPVYAWKKNGVSVGINSVSYSDSNIKNGDIISCTLTSNSNCASSDTATSNLIKMTVDSNFTSTITISSSLNNICEGTTVTFKAVTENAGTNPVYEWQKNGSDIGSNQASYTDSTLSDGDIISCLLIPGYACSMDSSFESNKVVMKVTSPATPSLSINTTTPSVCEGATVTFSSVITDGGTSRVYQWEKNGKNVGSNSNVYNANDFLSGDVVSCMVTCKGGCISSAPVESNIISVTVYNNPVVTLDHNNGLCNGTSRILDAGNFKSYLWNDGSTGRTLLISKTGTYFVEVTDVNGCKASDTSLITTIFPLPSGFLPADTSICTFGTIKLQGRQGYSDYLWSNNSTQSFINIDKPGTYWLRVKDNNDCMAQAFIVVSLKDCMQGFFIPSAFTPNLDGKNDVFRPLLFGNVTAYSFTIYNRFGQKVFETHKPGEGWNGTLKDIAQQPDVFVWTCTYQFQGDAVETKKGTVTLLR